MRLQIEEAVRLGAEDVADTVRQLAPKRRGRKGGSLKASIRTSHGNLAINHTGKRSRKVSQPSANGRSAWYVLAGDKDAFYAHMVEFGTAPHTNGGFMAGTQNPGTPPQPFFLPAWRMRRKYVKSRISRAMTKAVKQAVRGT